MFRYFIILIFLFSCQHKIKIDNRKIIFLEENPERSVYQRIEIFDVQKYEHREGKKKIVDYSVFITNSNKDTSVVKTNTPFYKGMYWAETIEKDKKIIFILSAEEYETTKIN